MERLSALNAITVTRNKTITQVASECGINQGFLSQVIQGKKNIGKEKLSRILNNLGYTLEQYEYLKRIENY